MTATMLSTLCAPHLEFQLGSVVWHRVGLHVASVGEGGGRSLLFDIVVRRFFYPAVELVARAHRARNRTSGADLGGAGCVAVPVVAVAGGQGRAAVAGGKGGAAAALGHGRLGDGEVARINLRVGRLHFQREGSIRFLEGAVIRSIPTGAPKREFHIVTAAGIDGAIVHKAVAAAIGLNSAHIIICFCATHRHGHGAHPGDGVHLIALGSFEIGNYVVAIVAVDVSWIA